MAWLAVDKSGRECVCEFHPIRFKHVNEQFWQTQSGSNFINLPKDSIEKLIGRKLTWEDEPVEL